MSDRPHFHQLDADRQHDRIAVLDLESGGVEGSTDPLIAIGAGHYDLSEDVAESKVFILDSALDQVELIRKAYDWLNDFEFDALVTYNGEWFDLPFLSDKLDATPFDGARPELNDTLHVDLAVPRFEQADAMGAKYPSLEECLDANEIPLHEVHWNGEELTNTRFGEELAPRFKTALEEEMESVVKPLCTTISDYTAADIEATAALYQTDAGREYTPVYPR